VPDLLSVATHPRRERFIIAGCVVGVATVAWAYLVRLDRQMSSMPTMAAGMASMGAMDSTPWSGAQWWLTFVMWTVMMIGMMSPSAMPALVLYAQTQSRRPHRGAMPVTVAAFGLSYLSLWVAFSVVAATAHWIAREAALMSPAMRLVSPRPAGGVLLLAGLYQFTPLKGKCLTQCQSPLGFLMSRWRDGVAGAVGMGVRHGLYCLGCCWALMAVLFSVGVMNLAWVAALTVFVLIEKRLRGALVSRVAGAAMIFLGALRVISSP
jgi:predicted metal-binding membrane protein